MGGGGRCELLTLGEEHDPPPGVEAAVLEDSARARVRAASPPRVAHGPEAEVIDHAVGGEDALGNQARRPIPEIRPVPPAEEGARALDPPG
jgi:hypothetical protein